MTAIRKTETHEAILRLEESSKGGEVGSGSRVWLDVDTPCSLIEVESLEGTLATENLELVDPPEESEPGSASG
jgi:hypothetical protein